jgi:hypothetical protein
MTAYREKDSSDYDLERLTDLMDQALTSNDPRVRNALRQLMMMVILTSGDHEDQDRIYKRHGPMRRMQEDIRDLHNTVQSLRQEIQNLQKQRAWSGDYRAGDFTTMKAQSGPDLNQAQSAEEYYKSIASSMHLQEVKSKGILTK